MLRRCLRWSSRDSVLFAWGEDDPWLYGEEPCAVCEKAGKNLWAEFVFRALKKDKLFSESRRGIRFFAACLGNPLHKERNRASTAAATRHQAPGPGFAEMARSGDGLAEVA